jgi:hypothetical protein
MKTLRLSFSLLAGWTGMALFATEAPPPAAPPAANAKTLPLSPRFQQVRDRVDALFQLRNETPPQPDGRANPFRPSGAGVPATAPAAPGEPAPVALPAELPAGDMALLQQAVASLKITGVVALRAESHVQINAKLYKKSDVVQTTVQGQVVYIRVRDITGRTATLALNDAEMTLKF